MGLFSQVVIGVTKKHQNEIEDIFKKYDLDLEFKESDSWQNDWITYNAKCLKWYSQYKDVKEVNEYIQSIGDENSFIVAVDEDGDIHSTIHNWGKFVIPQTKLTIL